MHVLRSWVPAHYACYTEINKKMSVNSIEGRHGVWGTEECRGEEVVPREYNQPMGMVLYFVLQCHAKTLAAITSGLIIPPRLLGYVSRGVARQAGNPEHMKHSPHVSVTESSPTNSLLALPYKSILQGSQTRQLSAVSIYVSMIR